MSADEYHVLPSPVDIPYLEGGQLSLFRENYHAEGISLEGRRRWTTRRWWTTVFSFRGRKEILKVVFIESH
jgi:hypothetical protein